MHFIEQFTIVCCSNLLLSWLPSTALAQTSQPADSSNNPQPKKETHLEFGKQTVEGKLHRPDTSLITASQGGKAASVLRIRKDFLDKMSATCGEDAE